MSSLSIPVRDLDNQGRDYVFALDAAWYQQALADTGVRGDTSGGSGQVEVHAQRNGSEILVHGRAQATLVVECGRCLKEYGIPVECELGALYAPKGTTERAAPGRAEAESTDQAEREYYVGEDVRIDDLVRDCLLLELPMQPSCEMGWACPNLDLPESVRAALASGKGSDFGEEEVDPRLLPLMKLAQGGHDKE